MVLASILSPTEWPSHAAGRQLFRAGEGHPSCLLLGFASMQSFVALLMLTWGVMQVFAFLRCFLLVSESNKVAVFAVHNSSR